MRADSYNSGKPFDDLLYKGKVPTRQEHNLGHSFSWSDKEQGFVDHGSGFIYDIFLRAYFGNGKYYQWDSHGHRYYVIQDPYIGKYRDQISSYLKPASGCAQKLELPKKYDPREVGLPTCYTWNSQANCFHSRIHNIYFDAASGVYYHDNRYWEWIEDEHESKYVILEDMPDLNHSVCWPHIKSSCGNPSCKLEHVPLRFPSNKTDLESSIQKEDINEKFYALLEEFVKTTRKAGITIPQVNKRIDKLLEKQYLSEDPQNLDYGKLQRTVDHVREKFCLNGKKKTKKVKKKKDSKSSRGVKPSVVFSGPYICPLCARTTSDLNRFLVHCDIHSQYTEDNFLNEDSFSGKPPKVEQLYKEELLMVMGNATISQHIQQVCQTAQARQGKYRARCYQYSNMAGRPYRQNLSCDVVHPIRTAFPDPFGIYSKSHVCPDDSNTKDAECLE